MPRPPLSVTIAIGAFAATGVTQASLQLVRANGLIARATRDDRFTVTRVDPPRRGSVLTADMKPLAQDIAAWELSVRFTKVPKSRGFFAELAAAAGIPEADLERLSDTSDVETWPGELDHNQAEAVERVKTRWRADGVSVATAPIRSYPLGLDAAAVTGTLDPGVKARGLEGAFEGQLRGASGKRIGLVDRTGSFEPARLDGSSRPKKDGEDVVTTIDSVLQLAASESIRGAVTEQNAVSGSIIIMKPATGEILAMAGSPSFNPSAPASKVPGERISGIAAPYMSRIEPGSMLKTLTLCKALDAGVVKPGDTYYCKGELSINRVSKVRCDDHHGNRAHGLTGIDKAIAQSCNVSAARWAMMIGRDPFFTYLDSLGLFQPTSLKMPAEIQGSINRKDYAWKLQLADLGFGQSLTCTPVELASAFTALGNDGVRMPARLVSRVGPTVQPAPPGKRVMTAQSAATVLGYMKGVFDDPHGTGRELRLPGYELAGKTGTAQKRNGKGGYVSNFIGFVPAEKPVAMILVMIDNPRNGNYYAASVAGPVFKHLAEAVIRRYHLPPTRSDTLVP
ncbi:MAG TPA: penicillin-binding protein 2 [Fimbriimonadaceae bacterium]|nr:penicillin-binding protein 2 [Fimbriimonadaceae bacterium]